MRVNQTALNRGMRYGCLRRHGCERRHARIVSREASRKVSK